MAIKQKYSSNPIIFDIQHYIGIASLNNILVKIRWTKAHADNTGNDRADELAKEAINLDNSQVYYKYYPESYAKRILRKKTIENWSKDWLDSRKGWVTKQFFPTVESRMSNKHLNCDFIITQYVTGHGQFRAYLYRFKKLESSLCICGNSEDTPLHRLTNCDLVLVRRMVLESECSRLHLSLSPDKIIVNKAIYIEFKHFINQIKDFYN
jgi:hypothetical protein